MSRSRVSMPTGFEPTGHVLRDSPIAHIPEVLEPLVALYPTIWDAGPLTPSELELVRLRNANSVGCVYCKAVRYDVAKDDGLDENKIADVQAGNSLSSREAAILAYTDAYLHDPQALSDELRQQLEDELGAQGIAHLSMALSMFNSMSRGAVAFGGMPEEELPIMPMAVPA